MASYEKHFFLGGGVGGNRLIASEKLIKVDLYTVAYLVPIK